MNGIIPAMPEAEYHAHSALSSTQARLILDSPAKLHYRRTHPEPPKDAFDLGSAVHSKVLGTGYPVEVLDFPDFRTKAAQTARDEARSLGSVPILRSAYVEVEAMAEAVLGHPTARALFEQEGTAEASVFARDEAAGVDLRARFDFLPDLAGKQPIAVDLKTAGRSASPLEFARSIGTYGYDVQQGHYLDTLELVTGERIPMVFVVVEADAPHLVAVHQLDAQFAEMGEEKARRARALFAQCTAADSWPGYPENVTLIQPPNWLIYQHMEKYPA